MKKILYSQIVSALEKAAIAANISLEADILSLFRKALKHEENELAVRVLRMLLQNAELALERRTPLCQDTGVGIVFVNMGQSVSIEGGSLCDAIQEGIEKGYKNGHLRKSIVASPFQRINTKTNTPAIIHYDLVAGDGLTIDFLAKGGGCENKSALKMLKLSDGIKGIKAFVMDTVKKAGAAACPPFFIGIGIGGNFEKCAILSKKALLRNVGVFSDIPYIKSLEVEILNELNQLNIGPVGVGGSTTAFSVAIEEAPCHIASLPVAINIDCHSHRHRRIEF